jgi:hypothetical protein
MLLRFTILSLLHIQKYMKFIANIIITKCSSSFLSWKYITQILHDQFIQKWFSDIENSSRGEFYSLFKTNFGLENYLLKLPVQNRIWMTKLRTCNLPSSTCTIKLGVEDLTFNIRLQKPKCTCSIILIFS